MDISKLNAINLFWDNGECNDYFLTDCPKKEVKTYVKIIQKIDAYSNEDLFNLIKERGFVVEQLGFEEINF